MSLFTLYLSDKQFNLQAVRHALKQQGLLGVFTSTQKANSIRQLLKQATSMLQEAKPNADVLMIMAIGQHPCFDVVLHLVM